MIGFVVLSLPIIALVAFLAIQTGSAQPLTLALRNFSSYPSHVSSAAYRFINMPWIRPSYLGGDPDQIKHCRAVVETKRKAALQITDAELRACVLFYLDWYDTHYLPEQEAELVDRTSAKRQDAYRAERKAEEEKIARLLKSATTR